MNYTKAKKEWEEKKAQEKETELNKEHQLSMRELGIEVIR